MPPGVVTSQPGHLSRAKAARPHKTASAIYFEVPTMAKQKTQPAQPLAHIVAIERTRDSFNGAGSLRFSDESVFAAQAIQKNDYTFKTARDNPRSVELAMQNLASTGLTLNPAHGLAYLVARDGAIVLDIGYRGLIKIATDAGAIKWARADVVHERDSFVWHGPAMAPTHTADVFAKDRGEIVGVYCIAKTHDGDMLAEAISREQLELIRSKSDQYARKKSGPWVEWFGEQCKKAVIKRAAKTWPYSAGTQRLFDAIDLANAGEGGYTLDGEAVELVTREQAGAIRAAIVEAGADEAALLGVYGVEAVDALPKARCAEVLATIRERARADR
jgi:recombination protein RecT